MKYVIHRPKDRSWLEDFSGRDELGIAVFSWNFNFAMAKRMELDEAMRVLRELRFDEEDFLVTDENLFLIAVNRKLNQNG
jgi:hypothetical protein